MILLVYFYSSAIVPSKHSIFCDGFFLSQGNTHLPQVNDNKRCVGGGMYPSDLTANKCEFREVWAALNSSARPTVAMSNAVTAIGVFVHRHEI